MVEFITNVNSAVNGFVWGVPMLVLLVGTGILMTILTKFFQLSHLGHWFKNTVGGIFHDKHVTKHTEAGDQSISQFQSLCTALAATIGTGNIVGVASALVAGGPGAIFWMWVVAFFGMMTNYSENVLGIYYRRRNSKGEWSGGAMYYLKDGLGSYKGCKQIGAVLAVFFSAFCLLASFGIGNMSQVNSIAANMTSAFSIPATATGIVLVIIGALVIVGGLKRIAAVTEKLVPFMAIAYVIGALVIFFANINHVSVVFTAIFKGAFGLRAVGGGIVGSGVTLALTWGMMRGVVSRVAGVGGAVLGLVWRRVLKRSRSWFLRYGAFQFQRKRARTPGYVGHLRSLRRHHGRMYTDSFRSSVLRTDRPGYRCRTGGCVRFRSGGSGFCYRIWQLRSRLHRHCDPAVRLLYCTGLESLRIQGM